MPPLENDQTRPLKRIVYATACAGWIVGLLVLVGWVFGIPSLKSVMPGFIAMQPWTAIGFIFSAGALVMAASEAPVVRGLSAAPATAVAFVGGSPLLQYITGYRFGTDVWLFPATVVAAQTHQYSDPGRMSQAAALGLTTLAGALLVAPRAPGRVGQVVFSILATTPLAAATLSLLNYVVRLEPLEALLLRNPLALHSALSLAALAIGTLALRPDAGWVRIAAEQGAAGWTTTVLSGTGALLLAFGSDAAARTGTIAANAAEASRSLEILLSTLKDAEINQRGYLLTGNDDYLVPYDAAHDRIPGLFAAAAAALVEVEEHRTDLDHLHALVDQRLTGLARTLALRRDGHVAEAVTAVASGRGAATMNSIRAEIDRLTQDVAENAADRVTRARHIAIAAAAGILGLAGLAYWALAATGRARHQAAEALADSAARQRDLLATLGLGTFIARDLTGAIQYWADGCERLYGWTAAEAVGRSEHELLGTISPVPLPAIDAALQRNGEWKGDLRHHTRDGQELVVTVHSVVRRTMQGQPAMVLEALTDVTGQRRAETALHDSQTLLHTIIETTPGLIYAKDGQGRMLMANSAAVGIIGKPWSAVLGRTDAEFLSDPAQAHVVMTNDQQVMRTGKTQETEEPVTQPTGNTRVFLSTKSPMRDAAGQVVGLVGVSIDITERKRDEERLRLMVNELNHRVKNTLATVQSITSQTLRGSDPAVQRTLEGRLQALASVHDVLTRESWKEAYLQEVVESALAPYGVRDITRFQIAGQTIRVQPRVAVAVSLALHELATNAIKYGALSTANGRVGVTWGVIDDAEPRLHMIWAERGGPPVVTLPARGFGTRLIERGLAQDLGGSARIEFNPEGVICSIDAKLNEVTPPAQPDALPLVGRMMKK